MQIIKLFSSNYNQINQRRKINDNNSNSMNSNESISHVNDVSYKGSVLYRKQAHEIHSHHFSAIMAY